MVFKGIIFSFSSCKVCGMPQGFADSALLAIWIECFVVGCCPVCYRVLHSIPGHCPLHASSTASHNTKMSSNIAALQPTPALTPHSGIPHLSITCHNLLPFGIFSLYALHRISNLCFEFLVRHFSAHPKGNSRIKVCIFLRLLLHREPKDFTFLSLEVSTLLPFQPH